MEGEKPSSGRPRSSSEQKSLNSGGTDKEENSEQSNQLEDQADASDSGFSVVREEGDEYCEDVSPNAAVEPRQIEGETSELVGANKYEEDQGNESDSEFSIIEDEGGESSQEDFTFPNEPSEQREHEEEVPNHAGASHTEEDPITDPDSDLPTVQEQGILGSSEPIAVVVGGSNTSKQDGSENQVRDYESFIDSFIAMGYLEKPRITEDGSEGRQDSDGRSGGSCSQSSYELTSSRSKNPASGLNQEALETTNESSGIMQLSDASGHSSGLVNSTHGPGSEVSLVEGDYFWDCGDHWNCSEGPERAEHVMDGSIVVELTAGDGSVTSTADPDLGVEPLWQSLDGEGKSRLHSDSYTNCKKSRITASRNRSLTRNHGTSNSADTATVCCKRLNLGNDGDFIQGMWRNHKLMELRFCQLTVCSERQTETIFILKRAKDYLLTTMENIVSARVMFDSLETLNTKTDVKTLKRAFFAKLSVLEILEDKPKLDRQAALEKFESWLEKYVYEHDDPVTRANILIIMKKYSHRTNRNLSRLTRNKLVPLELRHAIVGILENEYTCLKTERILYFLNINGTERLHFRESLSRVFGVVIEKHRRVLIGKCSSALMNLAAELRTLDELQIVYVTGADIEAFDHLTCIPCFQLFDGFFQHLMKEFSQCVKRIRSYTLPSSVIPVMNPVYGFLFKSFSEIVSEIAQSSEAQLEDMLKYESGDWKLLENIQWPADENGDDQSQGPKKKFWNLSRSKLPSLYHKSLEIQYKAIFEMIKHFSPGRCFSKTKFSFEFSMLERLSCWQRFSHFSGLAKRVKEERLAWLYIVDHTIHNVFKGESDYQTLLKAYEMLLHGEVSFIEKSPTDLHESFRVLMHSIIKFITTTAPYFRGAREKPGVDVEILVRQMWTFSNSFQGMDEDPQAFSKCRDLIGEYNRYLSLRLFLDTKAAPGHISSQISEMMETFMEIVKTSVEKIHVPNATQVGYFRSLNDFLDDFKNIDFPSIWYVKSTFYNPEIMEKVDSKVTSSELCTYRVTDIENYVNSFHKLRHLPPKHYIIQVVTELLGCIKDCLGKQWPSNDIRELQIAQLESTSVLLNAMRQSFLYLKEQPDYVDFEAFKNESVEPFMSLLNDCSSVDDLKKRADIVKGSFWHLRKMDEIAIDGALAMYKTANPTYPNDDVTLQSCYNVFLSQYKDHIAMYTCLLSSGQSHAYSLETVVEFLPKPKSLHFSQWTAEFKTQEIPILLAGLSAVWSILESKDISASGKFLKPHCIQILSILRLLSVDRPNGIENHLAQVLTGQGKSVILGLLSSVLALTGHKVRVLCYSEYLSSRDQNDFKQFFDVLQITSKIMYGTIEDMAFGFLNPVCNGIKTSLPQLVRDRILNHTEFSSLGPVTAESQDTVLLFDEVDVFFSSKFYGETFNLLTDIKFHGLGTVQQKIWSWAISGLNVEQIVQEVDKVIKNGVTVGDSHMVELNGFLNAAGSYPLLVHEKGEVILKPYTNNTLFHEHLRQMVGDALAVAHSPDDPIERANFLLNDEGLICSKDRNNIFRSEMRRGYKNIYNYFRLKKSDYDSKNFKNYGYLQVDVGSISFAQLPSQFKLILGVSGTLQYLGDYEKHAIESYNIKNVSILPSFFGENNLKFDKNEDFHCLPSIDGWLSKILVRANQILLSRRAVLVFFETHATMNLFCDAHKTKFDRLNELTSNTDAKLRDLYINEAGLPCTVTLATREMGRGVGFKSSVSVEKNGGVHVIQTFFSVDVNEQIQLQGRTARQDNKGSYEMIVCLEHLIKAGLVNIQDKDKVKPLKMGYSFLDETRSNMSVEKGKAVAEKVKNSEQDHTTTMKYFGLG